RRLCLGIHLGPPMALDELARRFEAGVEVARSDHRLARVGEHGGVIAPAALLLAAREHEVVAEADLARGRVEAVLAYQRRQTARQRTLILRGKGPEQHLRDHQAEHTIAEKLQALVVGAALRFGVWLRGLGGGFPGP